MSKITLVFSLLYHFWLEWSVWNTVESGVNDIEYNGIIAPVILEMLDDWSRIASCYNHLVKSDYSRSNQFQNGCFIVSLCDGGSDEHDKGNSNLKSANDAT